MTTPALLTVRASLPAPATRALLDLVARFTNRLEAKGDAHGSQLISAQAAPSPVEREAMEHRRAALREGLQGTQGPEEKEMTRASIAAVLGAFPSFGLSDKAAADQIRMTAHALADLPPWAVAQACRRFVRGEAVTKWDSSRAPTPPQLRAEALQVMLPIEGELHRLAQVLDAEVVDIATTPEERRAAVERWDKIRAGITRTNVVTERTAEQIAKDRAEWSRINERFDARRAAEAAAQAEGGE